MTTHKAFNYKEKEELQIKMELQWEEGVERLLRENQFLAEVKLEDLETTVEEIQEHLLCSMHSQRGCPMMGRNIYLSMD